MLSFSTAPNPCENSKGMDVAFLVDKTKSLGAANFLLLKGFLLEVTAGLQIAPNATHVAIMLFAGQKIKPNKHFKSTFADKKYYSNDAIHQAISEIPVVLGSPTFTDRAMKAADKHFFTEKGGDRPKFPNVLIVITDGLTNEKSEPFAGITASLKVSLENVIILKLYMLLSILYFQSP